MMHKVVLCVIRRRYLDTERFAFTNLNLFACADHLLVDSTSSFQRNHECSCARRSPMACLCAWTLLFDNRDRYRGVSRQWRCLRFSIRHRDGHSCLATETGTVAFFVYACRWLFVLRDVVFFHETGDAACFIEVLEGNHGLQERCLPFAEQK